jgi:hypothetical protein
VHLALHAGRDVGDIFDPHPGFDDEQRILGDDVEDPLAGTDHGADREHREIDVDAAELAANPQIQLYPGMPATVTITTKERTALDYLLGPLTASFDRAFREK